MRISRRWLLTVALTSFLPAAARAEVFELQSSWAPPAQAIDASAAKWQGQLVPLGDEPLSVGVRNDADFLYLCVRIADPATRGLVRRAGLTVWANGEGKTNRGFGVRFPARSWLQRPRGDAGSYATPDERRPVDSASAESELELIGPGEEDRLRIPVAQSDAVKVALDEGTDVMIVEMRIPLKPTDAHPLSIASAPGKTIAVGFETERPKPQEREGDRSSGGFSGGFGGGGGRMGGGGGMGGRGGMGGFGGGMGGFGGGRGGRRGGGSEGKAKAAKPVKIWTHVTLAPAAPPEHKTQP